MPGTSFGISIHRFHTDAVLVHHRHYRSRQEAIRDITEYIEIFYNRQRRQARLGFLSPAAFQQRFYAGLLAAEPVSEVSCQDFGWRQSYG